MSGSLGRTVEPALCWTSPTGWLTSFRAVFIIYSMNKTRPCFTETETGREKTKQNLRNRTNKNKIKIKLKQNRDKTNRTEPTRDKTKQWLGGSMDRWTGTTSMQLQHGNKQMLRTGLQKIDCDACTLSIHAAIRLGHGWRVYPPLRSLFRCGVEWRCLHPSRLWTCQKASFISC